MTILEKLAKVNADQAALAQRKSQLEADIDKVTQELVSVYGDNWEEKYNAEVKKLEEWDATVSA